LVEQGLFRFLLNTIILRKIKIQKIKNKSMAIIVAILLVLSTVGSIAMLPTSNAHTPAWDTPSYAYVVPAPKTIGVGQTGAVVMWADLPLPGATPDNDLRRHNYTLTITKPDGTTETHHWDVISDSTGIEYFQYTPTQVGTYMLKFDYGGQVFTWGGTYQNDIYEPSSRTTNWTVQQEQLPTPITSYPLPTEYWTHPIEGQNTDWWLISSNWLGSPQIINRFQPYGLAPNSFHVMWSKSIQEGGVVGGMLGTSADDPVRTFYMGGSYNPRFSNTLIMNGKLYYELPWGNSGTGGGYTCVDLRTGVTQWTVNTTQRGVGGSYTNLVPSFGWLYSYDDGNQHGVLTNGVLIATSGTTWYGYDSDTGVFLNMNITNVPTGTLVYGPQGSLLIYGLTNYGTTANPAWRLSEWNSTKLWNQPLHGRIPGGYDATNNASLVSYYDFNKSITLMNGAAWTIGSMPKYGGYMLLTQGSFGGLGDWYGANITCISLNPDNIGTVLWAKYFPAPPGNDTRALVAVDHETGVLIFEDQKALTHTAYSLKDGSLLWTTPPVDQYDYFQSTTRTAYGNFYFGGFGGILYCYDDVTGNLKWTYGNGGEGNTTNSGLISAFGNYPIFMPCIADGKIFLATTEHSPGSPYYKDALLRAVNATDGTEVWTGEGWSTGMFANFDIVADGYYAYFNGYDSKVYAIGKGPSETSVNIQNNVLTQGNSVLIEGSVIDISAGTQQDEQIARFPNGVPAVSDDSVSAWMSYVYFQKPRPTNTTGVPITLSVVDANGNNRDIGTTTSNDDGFFAFNWKPDIGGQYTVYASFGGSESYWPSHAVTAFNVDPAAPTPAPADAPAQSIADMYFVPAIAGLFVFVAIIGVVIILVLKKRP
jgi:hypothetical protein